MKNDKIESIGVHEDEETQARTCSVVTGLESIPKAKIKFKKIIFMASLAGLGICFNACTTGYVATEPSYVEYNRPSQPSTAHIWVNGNWIYSRHNHNYARSDGYWVKPTNNRTYMEGHWQSTPRGHHWVSGHWRR